MRGRNTVPTRRTNPPEPKHTHREHAIYDEPDGTDFDGFGRDEAEQVEGEPLLAIQEATWCQRDGCDADYTRRLLFTTHALENVEEFALSVDASPDSLAAYVHEHAERIGPETIRVPVDHMGHVDITAEDIIEDEPAGPCHGRPEEPSPEPYGL